MKNGVDADKYRVVLRAHQVHPLARRRAGDPLRGATARGDTAIGCGCGFECDQRAPHRLPLDEAGVHLFRFGARDIHRHGDASRA